MVFSLLHSHNRRLDYLSTSPTRHPAIEKPVQGCGAQGIFSSSMTASVCNACWQLPVPEDQRGRQPPTTLNSPLLARYPLPSFNHRGELQFRELRLMLEDDATQDFLE
jgi:hypothetical protein